MTYETALEELKRVAIKNKKINELNEILNRKTYSSRADVAKIMDQAIFALSLQLEECGKTIIDYVLKLIKRELKFFRTGEYYEKGLQLEKAGYYNYAKEFYLISLNHKKNNTYLIDSAKKLANLYLYGSFDPKDSNKYHPIDYKTAIKYYNEGKCYETGYYIGLIYYYGLGNAKVDYSKAFKYLSTVIGGKELGLCYYNGLGTQQNYLYAVKSWYYSDVFKEENLEIVDKFLYAYEQSPTYLRSSYDKLYATLMVQYKNKEEYYFIIGDKLEAYKEDASEAYKKYIEWFNKQPFESLENHYDHYYKAYKYVTPVEQQTCIKFLEIALSYNKENINNILRLARVYANGINTSVNKEKAQELYNRALPLLVNHIQNNKMEYAKDFIETFEYLNGKNASSIEYLLALESIGDTSCYYSLGIAYLLGNGVNKDLSKAKAYLMPKLKELEGNVLNEDIASANEYIKLFDLFANQLEITFAYKLAKVLNNDNKYTKEVGYAYANGNGVEKNLEKARKYLMDSLKELEKDVNEDNPKNLKEYIELYEKLYEDNRRQFKYVLAYALLGDGYANFLIGIFYEYGEGVEQDIEKAKAYFKRSYELGYEPAKDKYDSFFTTYEKPKVNVAKAIRYIQLLELNEDEDITIDDIKDSYRQLSKIYHPDIANKRYTDGKKFTELKDAHDYLIEYIDDIKNMVLKYFK